MTRAEPLSRRALSRATLARQFLLARQEIGVPDAMERLAGLNAQDPRPPYLSLWARLDGFARDDLTHLLYDRTVVRSSLLRGTQHMVTATDYLTWRPVLQPVLDRVQRGFFGRATTGIEPAEIAAAAREILDGRTLTRPELGRLLAERWPDRDPSALASSAQFVVAVVHPPPSGTWGTGGKTPFVLAESWLGRPLATDNLPDTLILRYLAAFGPASVRDIQAWCGLTRLREPVDRLTSRLRVFRDEHGQRLYDLPDAPRPDPDTPAPVRLLPEVDNILLGHADRTRVMTDEVRARVCIGAVVKATVLVDGLVAGTWTIDRTQPTLTVELFGRLRAGAGAGHRAALDEEGRRLLAFAAPEGRPEVRVVPAG